MSRSFKRKGNHCSSQDIEVKTRYLAFEDNLETVLCFLFFHETNDSPKKMQNLVVECRVIEQDAQSESLQALICKSDFLE